MAIDLAAASVLVVEDHDFTRNLILSVLRKIGVGSVREAASGPAAFRILGIAPVDVILCDIGMKPMDGITFLRRLRAGQPPPPEEGAQPVPPDAIDPKTPVIMLTAHTEADIVTRAHGAGATAFLVKPIKPDLLRSRIEAVLAARRRG
ncbi:response regulator [Azospirillum thermophilum]|nr:response regulator [Azospirillum thermophilum]